MARVITIAMNKGGTGKTVSTVSLAAIAAKQGWRTLIVDADHQGNALMSFGDTTEAPPQTIFEVLIGQASAAAAIQPLTENLDILPADDQLALIDFEVLGATPGRYPEPFHLLQRALAPVLPHYDYIFVDSPPSLGLMTGNALIAADAVIVPVQTEHFALRGLIKVLDAIEDIRQREHPRLEILGILPTMVDSRTTLASEVMQEIRRFYQPKGIRVFESVIPRSVRFAAAPAYQGKPAVLVDTHNPLVKAYYDLFEEAFGHVTAHD